MSYSTVDIKKKLENVLDAWEDCSLSSKQKRDILFHTTDWLTDAEKWSDFCENPQHYSSEELSQLLVRFLCHVPEHVAAAAKILLNQPIRDIFEVGVFSEDEEIIN